MICEFLGLGNQMVMPPSIHPDCAACGNKNVAGSNGTCTSCGAPSIVYSANSNLWEVLGDIPDLAENMEQQLRELLGSKGRSEEHTSELQSLMRISYAVFCLTKKRTKTHTYRACRYYVNYNV